MKLHKWKDIKRKHNTPEEIAASRREALAAVLELDLAGLRERLELTQVEMAKRLKKTQGEVSRIENRQDMLLSTLREVVEALGGKVEVHAVFDDERIRLRVA